MEDYNPSGAGVTVFGSVSVDVGKAVQEQTTLNLWVYTLEMKRVSCERTRISENRFQHVAQTRRGASQKRAEIMGDGEIQRLLRPAAQTRIRRGQRRIDRYRERADICGQALRHGMEKTSDASINVLTCIQM